jgi:hypothetical protein
MDIFFTVNKDHEKEENQTRAESLRNKIVQEESQRKYIEREEKSVIVSALSAYFDHIKNQ